jgi:hypothetical protein
MKKQHGDAGGGKLRDMWVHDVDFDAMYAASKQYVRRS